MAQIAPVGAKSFYVNGLQGLKDNLEALSGVNSIGGKLVLLSAVPTEIDAVGTWGEVGVAFDSGTNQGVDVGSLVLGHAPLSGISEVIPGEAESGSTETGWKLDFTSVPNVVIDNTNTAVCMALIDGVDTFAGGTSTNVRYVVDIDDLVVSGTVSIPAFSVEIQYGTNVS